MIDRPPEWRGRPQRDPGALAALSANGTVERLLYNDRGDAHGVALSDKTIVRFPPHVAAGLASQLTVGRSLHAVGCGTRRIYGTAMEATRMGAAADSLREVFGMPQAMQGAAPGNAPGNAPGPAPGAPAGTPPRNTLRPVPAP